MATRTTKKTPVPLVIRGHNATGKTIEGVIPAGELSAEDPGLAIQRILAKHKDLVPAPILPE